MLTVNLLVLYNNKYKQISLEMEVFWMYKNNIKLTTSTTNVYNNFSVLVIIYLTFFSKSNIQYSRVIVNVFYNCFFLLLL